MDFNKYLLENLLDCYEKYCSFAQEMSDEDIDAMYFDTEGHELSDEQFFFEHSNDVLGEEVIDALYTFICDMGTQHEIDLDRIVSFLCGRYIVHHYDSSTVTNYLRATDIKDIVDLFVNNINFGMALVKDHFDAMLNHEKYSKNFKVAQENKDDIALNKFATKAFYEKIQTLNNLLRGVICNIYDYYISNGCEDVEALNMTWMYFFQGTDPVGELDKMGMDDKTKFFYRQYSLGLVFADLYEDVCNDSIIQSDNMEDRAAQIAPLLAMRIGAITLPADEGTRNRVLKHFILLQDEREKMESNRKKTYQDGRIKELKKFNPLYKLDEMKF